MRRALCVICIGLLACSRVDEGDSQADRVQRSAGCYRLSAMPHIDATDTGWLSARLRNFRLQAEAVSASRPMLHVVSGLPREAYRGGPALLRIWAPDSMTDTLRVSVGDGFTGIVLSVVRTPSGTLRGRAVNFADNGPTWRELGLVMARGIPCEDTAAVSPPADGLGRTRTDR